MQDKARYSADDLVEIRALVEKLAERKALQIMPKVESELPPGTPLMLGISQASVVFDTSERQLRKVIKIPGFPVVRLGASVKILTYDALQWFKEHEQVELPE